MNSVHWAFLTLTAWMVPIGVVAYQSSAIPETVPAWYIAVGTALALYATGRQALKSIASLKGKSA